jgi:hypothetical protein
MRGIAIEAGLSRELLHMLTTGQKRLGARSRAALSTTLSNMLT